jgi:hypothetical protein
VREILRQRDVLHEADIDVLVLDLGLAGFEAFGIAEADADLRSLLGHRFDHERDADQRGDQRNHPDQRRQPVAARFDLWIGQVGW